MENNTLSQQTIDNLNELSQTFKPLDVRFLVSLNSDSSLQECNDDAITLIGGLKKYVENNHSLEGLDEATRSTFGNIKVYRTKKSI